MDTAYIYSGTRAKALENELLNETQVERLISAKSISEVYSVLQDTFLAMEILKHGEENITEALDSFIIAARRSLESMSPHKEVLDILWLKYDYHNLKTIIKARKAGLDDAHIKKDGFAGGKYTMDELMEAFEDGTLSRMNSHFTQAVEKARTATHVFEIDLSMNEFYFKTIKAIALASKDMFVQDFVKLQIDLFNVKAALRAQTLENIDPKMVFVPGGTFSRKDLDKKKSVLESLKKVGSEKEWTDAIALFEKTNDYTHLERAADEHVVQFLKSRSTQLFSPAPLFAYFTLLKGNAQLIGAIIVAKRSGVDEKELRTLLRRVYG